MLVPLAPVVDISDLLRERARRRAQSEHLRRAQQEPERVTETPSRAAEGVAAVVCFLLMGGILVGLAWSA